MNILQEFEVTDRITENLDYGLITLPAQGQQKPVYSWTSGTGAGQVDLHWEKAATTAVTLAAGASVTYTLSALTDAQARPVAFARVDKLVIWITSKTGNDYLTVGGAALHDWVAIVGATGNTFVVRGLEVKVAGDATGFVVTSGVSDQIKITNSGSASITFWIALSGRSA